jgi:tRNA pseudouridine38-40 synthase
MTADARPPRTPQTWKLTLAYDGTGYSGWQIQPREPTIQGELQAALGRVTGESPLPQGSGRTDAGVHAIGQVASFQLLANIPPQNLQRALNRTLPPAIRVLESKTVRSTFHARHATTGKTYEYQVFREAICPPFLVRYVYACPWPMDVELLKRSARLFLGEHNFLSFAATDPDLAARKLATTGNSSQDGDPPTAPHHEPPPGKRGATRTIYASTWTEQVTEHGPLLVYRIRGNGFLHHMVRNLVGTMLEVGRGSMDIDAIPAILAARCRDAAGPTAPAQGLFLHSVDYNEAELTVKTE